MKFERLPYHIRHGWPVLGVILLVAGIFFWRPGKPVPVPAKHVAAVVATTNLTTATNLVAAPKSPAPSPLPYATFQKRPFAVALQTGNYGWTTNDGRDPLVIRELAHNDFEYRRMLDENSTIYRRQLVYQKNPFSLAAQRAVHFDQPLSRLTLPNLDGQELTVDISRTEIEAGGDRGILTGRLAGRPDSLVSIAFIGGREGFTVVSPADKIYLYAEPREPGELVVKRFDPATYGGVLAGCGVK